MTFSCIRRNIEVDPIRMVIVHFIMVVFASIAISNLVHDKWVDYLEIYHTILELACVFIAVSIFFCIWYIYERSSSSNYVLGFGYLAVGIFDSLHTFYFLKLNLNSNSYFDLSTRYWIIGRLIEAITLLLAVKAVKVKGNKWIKLVFLLAASFIAFYIPIKFHDYLPVLLTLEGVTQTKVALEYLVIGIYAYSLYKSREKLKDKSLLTYKYIFMALFLSISSEICFTLYSSVQSPIWTLGHILKILSYHYIFKGIFISSITFPHRSLEEQRDKLEESNNELNSTTETLNDILDALPVGVLTYDQGGRVKYTNKKFEELLKCEKNDVYGLTSEELLIKFPRVEGEKKSVLHQTLKGDAVNTIRTYRRPSGDTIKLSLKSKKVRNGVLVLFNDANDEQKFDNLHIQTETILNAVSNGIMMIDSNKKIVLCNKAIADMLELESSEIIGRSIDDLNEFIRFDSKHLPNESLSGADARQCYETSLISANGNRKELMMYVSPIKNLYGEVIGGISISTDVTEINKRQKKILQQEKLALLGQMGAAIVHETRNYLTTIKGRCQLIELYAVDEKVKLHAGKINDEIEEVNRIISEFLFLSKPRETELTETSMHDIFQSIKSMVTTGSLVKGVDVEIELCKEERYLLCDESQVKQIILNLCKNAVEAMGGVEEPKLRIETGYIEKTNEMYISVKDNGKGIKTEDLKKLGTPFFTTKDNGTGLGISVCHKIAREHNGRLEIDSRLGEGATFTLIIPCIEDEDLEEVI